MSEIAAHAVCGGSRAIVIGWPDDEIFSQGYLGVGTMEVVWGT